MDASLEPLKLSQLIERQLEILSALLVLAQQQSGCLGVDDVEVLLSMLARKQPLLAELLELQSQLRPYRDVAPEQRTWQSAAQRESCQQIAEACAHTHQEILRLETSTLSELEQHRNAIAAQLQDGRDATLASTAYSAESMLDECSFDLTNS